jgi:hypothetical protein
MMVNGTSIAVLRMGTVSITINGIPVKLIHCYHTPRLQASIYSPHSHRQTHHCSFLGYHNGMYSTFGRVLTSVQDDIDCCIQLCPLPYHSNTKFALYHTAPPHTLSIPNSISSTSDQATDATYPGSVRSASGHMVCPHTQDRLLHKSFPALSSSETHPEGLYSHWLSQHQKYHGL